MLVWAPWQPCRHVQLRWNWMIPSQKPTVCNRRWNSKREVVNKNPFLLETNSKQRTWKLMQKEDYISGFLLGRRNTAGANCEFPGGYPPLVQAEEWPAAVEVSWRIIQLSWVVDVDEDQPSSWANNDQTRRVVTPKWWFSKGNLLVSGKSRVVKYYNLARTILTPWKMNGWNLKMEADGRWFVCLLKWVTFRFHVTRNVQGCIDFSASLFSWKQPLGACCRYEIVDLRKFSAKQKQRWMTLRELCIDFQGCNNFGCKKVDCSNCVKMERTHTVDGKNPAPPGMYKTL